MRSFKQIWKIVYHFRQYPDCLTDDDFTYEEFVAQFCTGFAGSQADYLNKQCERLTNVVGSTVCDVRVIKNTLLTLRQFSTTINLNI